jgi:hypothetical protein
MKKQELIHLHGLLSEVRQQCETWEGGAFDLSEYESTGVRPTSIHKSKTAHKAAVFELTHGITRSMSDVSTETEQERVAASAD